MGTKSDMETSGPKSMRQEVVAELQRAKALAETLDIESVKSGEWFLNILKQVSISYDRNARAAYFQQKYPGLPTGDVADALTSVTVRYASIAGGVAGAATSTSQVTAIAGGLTIPLFVSTIGAEMLYLARIQMRLVLDLANLYEIELDPEDPEDMLMVFGYALGAAPSELGGRLATHAAGHGTKAAVKKVVSGATLKAIQDAGRKVGFKILQRSVIKYAVPAVSAAVGSGYNYITTRAVGRVAKSHFTNRGHVTDEIRRIIMTTHICDATFPAAIRHIAEIDGHLSPEENKLLKGMVTRMTIGDHQPEDIESLLRDEQSLLTAMSKIEDLPLRRSLLDALVLMATSDGQVNVKEGVFLTQAAERLDLPLDLDEVAQQAEEFRAGEDTRVASRVADAGRKIGDGTTRAAGAFGRVAAKSAKAAAGSVGKVAGKVASATPRRAASATCPTCSGQVTQDQRFCPSCGTALDQPTTCSQCGAELEASHKFCAQCGTLRASST